MVKAFEDRCKTMYGPSSLTNGIDNKKRKNGAITKSSLRKKHDEIIAARKVDIYLFSSKYFIYLVLNIFVVKLTKSNQKIFHS